MISTRPGTPARAVLEALVQLGDATTDDLVGRLLVLPPLTPEDCRGPGRLELLRARQRRRDEERARIGRLLGRLQEQGLVEGRSPARVSGAWRTLCAKRGEVEALRCMSGWEVREGEVEPYLQLILRVESTPHLRTGEMSGVDNERMRRLIRWDVVVPPSVRRATEEGRALVEQT